MNQSELIDKISRNLSHLNVSKSAVSAVLGDLGTTVKAELKAGNEVTLPSLGKFTAVAKAARAGRNPQTGQTIEIAARTSPKFTAGKAFKDALNN